MIFTFLKKIHYRNHTKKKKKCFIILKNGIKSGIVISHRFELLYASHYKD